jgi:hypothetical protein
MPSVAPVMIVAGLRAAALDLDLTSFIVRS